MSDSALQSALLEIKNLSVTFHSGGSFFAEAKALQAVNNVSFRLRKGESLGIVGESGCGKSTIARVLAGMQKVDSGEILFKGVSMPTGVVGDLQARLQMVFQDPFSSLNPRIRIWRQVAEPLRGHGGVRDSRKLKERALQSLLQVGLKAEDAEKYPHQFSGGQRQRIAIARALILEPEIMVADEPTASLDVNSQEEISFLLKKFVREKGLTLILISHDLSSVRDLTDRVMVLYMGQIMEEGPTEKVLNRAFHPYTRALLESAPSIKQRNGEKKAISGEVPSAYNLPPGCPFQNRCPKTIDICRSRTPDVSEISSGHFASCFLDE